MKTTHRTAQWTVAAFTVASMGIVGCSSDSDGTATNSTTSTLPRSEALWGPPGTAALPAASVDALQAAIDTWVESGKLDGLTAAVVTSDGVWSGAAGVDGAGTALQPDSALSLQSVSKTFTSAEVLVLSSRGLVDLDAPITNYVDVPFDTAGATVQQLLAMRSGFPDYAIDQWATNIAADLGRIWTFDEILAALPADADRAGTVGGSPSYNGVNYLVLGRLIEQVTGQSYAEALRADLLDPAGLTRAWVQPAETPTAPLTVGGQTAWADVVDPAGPFMPSASFASFVTGGGSIAADAADAARWGYLLYGGQVIDSTLVNEMVADPQAEPNIGPYALGVMVGEYDGVPMFGHAGGGTDYPYATVLQVFGGDTPISIAILAPQAADHGSQIFEVFMQLYDIVAS